MIRKANELRHFTRSPGVEIYVLVEPDEMHNAGRLYARIVLAPGASLAYHRHDGEMESFYVIKGTCRVEDNGAASYLSEGDVMITPAGECHAVHNESDCDVEIMALIVSCVQGVDGGSVAV